MVVLDNDKRGKQFHWMLKAIKIQQQQQQQ